MEKGLVGADRGTEEEGVCRGIYRKIQGTKGKTSGYIRGKRRNTSNVKGAVLEEQVWGDLKFPKEVNEVPYSSQQKHANKNGGRRREYSQQGFNEGVWVHWEVLGSNRENGEVSQRASKKDCQCKESWNNERAPAIQGIIPTQGRKRPRMRDLQPSRYLSNKEA